MPARVKRQIPRFQQTHPDHLATHEQLRALNLKAGTPEPDALFEYDWGDRSGVCGLFDKAKAVPLEASRDAARPS